MTEQSRIITEEQWREYRQLLCLKRQWERERQELEEQLKEYKGFYENAFATEGDTENDKEKAFD